MEEERLDSLMTPQDTPPPLDLEAAKRQTIAAALRKLLFGDDDRGWDSVDAPNKKAWLEKADIFLSLTAPVDQGNGAREALDAAMDYIDKSPCDPDINVDQFIAWQRYQKALTALTPSPSEAKQSKAPRKIPSLAPPR